MRYPATYRLAPTGEITQIAARPPLVELSRILVEKSGWDPVYVEEVVAQLLRLGELVDPHEEVPDIEGDPAHNRVLEAAATGAAGVIVSGDRHLRSRSTWRGIEVLNPATSPDGVQQPPGSVGSSRRFSSALMLEVRVVVGRVYSVPRGTTHSHL